MLEFKGKTALVTGGARDIGRATSVRLAQLGATVVVNYRGNRESAEETLRQIGAVGGHGVLAQGDITVAADVARVVETAGHAGNGRIDVLVNLAGGLVARKAIADMDEAFWDQVIALNLKSVFLVTKAALPLLPDGAAIVNVSSQAARDGGGPGASAYATAKAGVSNFTRAMAKELAPRRIRVNCVSPGMIATQFHDTFTKPEVRQRVAGMTPLGREGRAEEVADAITYLASERASFINGESLEINGGIFFA
ncbi:SDR family NAD(P)-dependent oxidoreductase [Oleiharenicola sp. Vm1]|uniref:SDR family NAD(P)-dependent oxidoreductase n=1 Tax=Oleiharenicola sp. Vm1 TaxID=3398393 RepID=UPI0039F5723B